MSRPYSPSAYLDQPDVEVRGVVRRRDEVGVRRGCSTAPRRRSSARARRSARCTTSRPRLPSVRTSEGTWISSSSRARPPRRAPRPRACCAAVARPLDDRVTARARPATSFKVSGETSVPPACSIAVASSTNIRLSKPSSASRESSETCARGRFETCATMSSSQAASCRCASRRAVPLGEPRARRTLRAAR